MQVRNNPQIPDQINSPNFRAIKSVKCEGLYKKYPQYADKLVYSFRNNPVAMNFCKDRDVDIVFHACKFGLLGTKSSIYLLYDNPVKSMMKKIFDFITRKRECIKLTSWGNKYDIKESLVESTDDLASHLSPWSKGKGQTGLLDSHIENAEKEIQEALAKKSKRQEEKLAKNKAQKELKIKEEIDLEMLQSSIKDLIETSK